LRPAADTILLTGATGQVGGELAPLLQEFGSVVAPSRTELDLADADSIREVVRRLRPQWIVNPAAYTAVDRAESDADTAFALNRDAVRVLGEEAVRAGSVVVHFSTDYVFNGEGSTPWREGDPTAPLGVYGASKLAGEEALRATGAAHFIFRTSWVYGASGKNFLKTILQAAREREQLKIVDDQHGAPTWSRDLAYLVVHAMQRVRAHAAQTGQTPSQAAQQLGGVYHAAGGGETTWFGFAQYFLGLAKERQPERRWAKLAPVTSADFPTAARRPGNSRLSGEKLGRDLGFQMPPWQVSTAAVVDELMSSEGH
jgi:dTDP-4-dehydrorhamnose reductase